MTLAERLALLDSPEPPDVTPRRMKVVDVEEDRAAELEDLTGLALSKMREILEAPTDWDAPKAVQLQLSAAQSVLTAQVRVDEGRLKKRKLDILPKLLDIIAREESRMAPRLAAGLLLEG